MDKAIYSAEQLRLSALLRRARLDAGLRQQDVADALGMPQSFVSKYETGERRLDLIELRQVCRVLGVPVGQLVATLDHDGSYDQRAASESAEPAGPQPDSIGPEPDASDDRPGTRNP